MNAPQTSRRATLGASVAMLLGGAKAAEAAVVSPDAALIADCELIEAQYVQLSQLYLTTAADDDPEIEALHAATSAAVERAHQATATTWPGKVAKARAAWINFSRNGDGSPICSGDDVELACSALADIIGVDWCNPLRPGDWTAEPQTVYVPAPYVHPDAELMRIGVALETAWTAENAYFADGRSMTDEEIDAGTAPAGRLVALIESIPAHTLHGLGIKARALAWCCDGEEEAVEELRDGDNPSTASRLAAGIVADLLRVHAL